MRIAVQERRRLYRDALAALLSGEPGVDEVDAVASPAELTTVARRRQPELVVLEGDPAEWDAAQVVRRLVRAVPTCRIVALQVLPDPTGRMRLEAAGATAVVGHAQGTGPLLDLLRYVPPSLEVRTASPHEIGGRRSSLTVRELEVLRLVARGSTSAEAGRVLGISAKTVENHKRNLFAKLGVQNQSAAVATAVQRGLISPVTLQAHSSP